LGGILLASLKICFQGSNISDGFYLRQFRQYASIKISTKVAFGLRVSSLLDGATKKNGAFNEEKTFPYIVRYPTGDIGKRLHTQ
jgi:hypothetical protein